MAGAKRGKKVKRPNLACLMQWAAINDIDCNTAPHGGVRFRANGRRIVLKLEQDEIVSEQEIRRFERRLGILTPYYKP